MDTHDAGLMRVFGFQSYGGPEVARFLDVPALSPAHMPENNVLISTDVTSVNPADIKVRAGERHGSFPVLFPMAMGREAAGIVLAANPASGFAPGMAVFGIPLRGSGSCAERVYLDGASATSIPEGVTPAQAACIPVAAGTAWDLLNEIRRDGLASGGTILVLGAGGGVGHCVVQLAGALGYRVIGVSSASKRSFVESLGATHIAAGPGWRAEVRDIGPVDGVLDMAGGAIGHEAIGLTEGPVRSIANPSVGGGVIRHRTREVFTELADFIAEGIFTPRISASYPFNQAAAAFAAVETGHATGKTVITF